MKNILLLLFSLPIMLFAQSDKAPNLYEYITIQPKDGQNEAFEAAVKAHNAKFHAAGPHKAELTYNINGPSGGMYTWVMGPTSWTAMDSRPEDGAHDEDWAKVTALSARTGSPSYWSMNTKLSRNVGVSANTKRLIWIYDVKSGEMARWFELAAKISEVYKEKRPTETFIVGSNEFANTKNGYDVAVSFAFEKWSWMDRESTFGRQFEEVHGEGSWHTWQNAFMSTVEGRIDWLRETVD